MRQFLTTETFADLTLPLVDGTEIKIVLTNPSDAQLRALRGIEQVALLNQVLSRSLGQGFVSLEDADTLRAIDAYVQAG